VETKVTGLIQSITVIGIGRGGHGDGNNIVTIHGSMSLPTGKKPTTQEK
jgi:hypothetical protein